MSICVVRCVATCSSEMERPPLLHCCNFEEVDRSSVSSPTSDTTDSTDISELSSGDQDHEGGWGWVVVAASFYCVAIVGGVRKLLIYNIRL